MGRKTLISLALLGATTAVVAQDAVPAQTSQQPEVESFEGRLLATHNAERAVMQVAPLRWNASLEADARAWAKQLAKTGTMRHADQSTTNDAGENLWAGPTGYHQAEDMVGLFIEEKRYFKAGNFPNVSTTGRWQDVGHYTQIIWPTTQQVGCALAEGEHFEFLVCRYYPAGNWRKKPVGFPVLSEAVVAPAAPSSPETDPQPAS